MAPYPGIATIIGCVQEEFPQVDWVDAYAERLGLAGTVRRIREFGPDVVAAAAYTTQMHEAAATARAVRAAGLKAKFVVGGPHTSRIPEESAREFPEFDYIAAGEGEGIVLDLLRALRNGESADNIPGIYCLRGNEVVSGGRREFIQDLDAMPLPEWKHVRWDAHCAIFALRRERIRETAICFNRGCPFNCIFCAKIMGNKVRRRSCDAVVEQMRRDVSEYGAQQILFTDETFTIDRDRSVELFEKIIRAGLPKKTRWVCITRPDKLDEELISLMKRSGCHGMCLGADSVFDETLEFMNKSTKAENIFSAIRLCRKHGILTEAGYIIGLPTDTAASVKRMIAGAVAADSDFATFAILVPYPGTKIMDMAERGDQGLRLLSKDWRHYGKQLGCAMETDNLSRSKLEKLQRTAYYRFYLRPRKFFNAMRMADLKVVFLYLAAHILRRLGVKPPGPPRDSE